MKKISSFNKDSLLVKKYVSPGRSSGRVTVRHKQGGAKKKVRVVDFKRTSIISGVVKDIVYDPNRNVDLALVLNRDTGKYHYIITPKNLKIGDEIGFNKSNTFEPGNTFQLKDIPVGTSVHNIELQKERGGVLVRSAGTSATILGFDKEYAIVKLPSKQTRLILMTCVATIGEVGNEAFRNKKIGKAGRARHMGKRPSVRGTAMNAVDHPHGGGESKARIGGASQDPWGNLRGKKTRRKKNKYNKFILVSRKGEKVV